MTPASEHTENGASERPPDVAAARRLLVRRLAAAGVPSPEADAMLLLEAALGVDRATLLLQADRPVSGEAGARLAAMLRRRVAREPLQLILGHTHFYGLELGVSEGVLIPRPETERLVELTLQELRANAQEVRADAQEVRADAQEVRADAQEVRADAQEVRAGAGVPAQPLLDVGCGSGAIALALKAELPGATVWGCDVDPAAVALSRSNAAALGLDVTFRLSDLLADADVAQTAAHCAALVANPPYLPAADGGRLPPEVDADPATALFGGEDGLDVARRLAWQAHRLLPAGALLALELDPRNVRQMARELVGWRGVRVEADLAGRERFVLARR